MHTQICIYVYFYIFREYIQGWCLQLNGIRTLLKQGINSNLVTQLINNKADLRDIALNVQILLDGGIRVDLVNGWLGNRTHLNDAIAVVNQGVDLNLIGTSSKVGDFTGLAGATPNEVVARIPVDVEIEEWTPLARHAQEGMKFKWKDASGRAWRVRMHDPDPSAPAGSNAASGWVLRVQSGKKFMDADGDFIKPSSPDYTEEKANETHIPIQPPPSTKSAS
jgi:Bacterial toxin 30